MFSPEFACEVELKACKRDNFKKLDPNDYA